MISHKNILYCTDYSEDADIAFIHAVDMAKRYQAKLHILYVLDTLHRYNPVEARAAQAGDVFVSVTPELEAQALAELKERYQGRLEGLEDVVWSVTPGVPFVEIVRYAREKGVDLIIMGTTGRTDLERISYGSTVENVSRRAHCHVMAVRNPERTYTL